MTETRKDGGASYPKCWRVWYVRGTARLVDAHTETEARAEAARLDKEQEYSARESRVKEVECLD